MKLIEAFNQVFIKVDGPSTDKWYLTINGEYYSEASEVISDLLGTDKVSVFLNNKCLTIYCKVISFSNLQAFCKDYETRLSTMYYEDEGAFIKISIKLP